MSILTVDPRLADNINAAAANLGVSTDRLLTDLYQMHVADVAGVYCRERRTYGLLSGRVTANERAALLTDGAA